MAAGTGAGTGAGAGTGPTAPGGQPGGAEPNHGLRIFLIWAVACAIATPLVYFVWGPHMPPGAMGSAAAGQQWDNTVMGTMATPVVLGVLVYFGYAITVWRHREGDDEDGPAIHGNLRIQLSWIAVTSAIVLSLFAFGTYELVVPAGAGAGEGPSPIWTPGGDPLQVQVIGQQWNWTFRYPQYGGMETDQLVLPVGQSVQFNVTSLDVIHSFWAYQLGVKADANPGANNVAYVTPQHTGSFTVRCAELCGVWHGAMFTYGKVDPVSAFQLWARSTETKLAAVTKDLPPYATTYDPTAIAQISKVQQQLGITGAGGGYYPPQDPSQP
jgi:cytochrome c oxidase subunit 2